MSRYAVFGRMSVWTAFVAYCAVAMANGGVPPDIGTDVGPVHVTLYDVLIVAAFAFAIGDLLRSFFDRTPSAIRTIDRILLVYMAFEAVVVLPVGVGLGVSANHVIHTMTVRFVWLLVPTVWALCREERTRRMAGTVVAIAAVGLVLWGIYVAATGGAGFYYESGDLRYRVLWGGASLLFAWPFVVAASGLVKGRLALAFIGIALIGLALTNHRSGFVAFAIVAVFCVVASGNWRLLVVWSVPAALVVMIALLLAGVELGRVFGYTLGSLLDFSSGNGADRLMRWRLAWEMFTSRPVNDYVWSWSYYLVHLQDPYPPHNFVLEIATTEGVAGLLFYAAVLWKGFRAGWRWVRTDTIARALVGYLIVYLTFSAANATLYQLATAPLLVAAVAATVARGDQLRTTEAVVAAPARTPRRETPYG
jgi:hypothetical protein